MNEQKNHWIQQAAREMTHKETYPKMLYKPGEEFLINGQGYKAKVVKDAAEENAATKDNWEQNPMPYTALEDSYNIATGTIQEYEERLKEKDKLINDLNDEIETLYKLFAEKNEQIATLEDNLNSKPMPAEEPETEPHTEEPETEPEPEEPASKPKKTEKENKLPKGIK